MTTRRRRTGRGFRDWEIDLVIGGEQKSVVLTLFERSSSMFVQTKLPSKKTLDVQKAVIRLLMPCKAHVHIITNDNGIEFINHEAMAKALGCTVYFADLYCPGRKWSREHKQDTA